MHAFRSRVGVVSVATGAAVLLALPVVATGQVPGVDQVVGGVKETAETVVPLPAAPALPSPPAQVQAPAPEAAAPPRRPRRGRDSAPAAPAPAASAPAAPRQSASAAAPRRAAPARPRARSASKAASAAKDQRWREGAHSAADTSARASQDELAGEESAWLGRQRAPVADLPEDASPDTLPFTGLQLALIVMAGLAALAAGAALRRGTRFARR